jgi:hypothetical protein
MCLQEVRLLLRMQMHAQADADVFFYAGAVFL